MAKGQPRVIIGKRHGTKVRLRYPSQMGGYIQYTYSSIWDATKHMDGQSGWAKRRAVLIDPETNRVIREVYP